MLDLIFLIMIYIFFRFLFRIAVSLYYKKIYLHKFSHIPQDKALIICSNHGNSFMDAVFIAVQFPRKIHFLARADVFDKPLNRWFLQQLNMMPIYRIRDGRNALAENEIIFDKCRDILSKNGAILIFPEGNCVVEKRLRSFKSGFADLALRSDLPDLHILPVSINYNNPLAIRDEISVYVSHPLYVDDFKSEEDHRLTKNKLINKTCEDIYKNMLTIPDSNDDVFFDTLFNVLRSKYSNYEFSKWQKPIIDYFNQLKKANHTAFCEWKSLSINYTDLLQKFKIKESSFLALNLTDVLMILINFCFWVPGKIINIIPSFFTNLILKKVKDKQFLSAVRMAAGTFIYMLYLVILIIILAVFVQKQLLYFSLIVWCSLTDYLISEKVSSFYNYCKLQIFKRRYTNDYQQIKNYRNKILQLPV